jgi:hypothetical protein
MVILIDGVRHNLLPPVNEEELERRIREHSKDIFGEDSVYFDKKKIRSKARVATIPDAYLIVFDRRGSIKPKWCILEIEMACHSVYDHVLPQMSKFRRAIEDASTRRAIVEFFYEVIKDDPVIEAQIKVKTGSGEIHKFISDLVADKPLIVVVTDERTPHLLTFA